MLDGIDTPVERATCAAPVSSSISSVRERTCVILRVRYLLLLRRRGVRSEESRAGGMMIKIFGGARSDHPLADLGEAKRLLAELPGTDPLRAVDELTHWLESARTEQSFKPEHRAMLVQMLDE